MANASKRARVPSRTRAHTSELNFALSIPRAYLGE
jgi:hypothetical protein